MHHSILVSLYHLSLKVFVLGFCEINYLYIFEMNILKCGVSLEWLFKSGGSLEGIKGAWSQKSKRADWNHNSIVLLEGLVWKS